MNHIYFVFLCLCALVFSACKQSTPPPAEDTARILSINSKFDVADYETALTEAQSYVEDFPQSADGWNLLGWSYAKTDQFDKANESFDRCLEIDPSYDNAHVGRGVVARKQNDLDKAVEAYLSAIKIVPDNAEAYSSLSVIEILRSNDKKAVEYGEKAWGIRKDLPSVAANLCIAYHYLGNHDKRDQFMKEAKRLNYHSMQGIQDIIDGKVNLR